MTIYRRCRKCRGTSKLPDGVRVCKEHGKGSVVWSGQVEIGSTGQRSRRSVGYHSTREEAEAAAAELSKAHRTGQLSLRNDLTLGEWLQEWLDGPAKMRVRPTTLRSYRFQVAIIQRHLGDIRLQKLTLGQLQQFYVHLVSDDGDGHGLTTTTARRYHALLHRALKVAVKRGLVDRNVLADEDAFEMRANEPEHTVWTVEQLAAYLNEAMQHRLGSALWLLAFSGARRGEVVGVRWSDIDLDAAEWTVVRAMLVTGEGIPKSKAGRRVIGLDDDTIEMLRAWRSRQRAELIASGINPLQHPKLPVFTTPGGVETLHPDTLSSLHPRVVKNAGLPRMRMHGLRHLHGSLLVQDGESLKAVSTRLGHSSAAFTLSTYIRDLPTDRREVASRFGSIMRDAAAQ